MNSMEKNLSEILDIDMEEVVVEKTEVVVHEMETDDEFDFTQARVNIKEAIRKGNDALNGILDLAASADEARPYEVAATLVKTLVEANKDLMNLHKQRKDLKGESHTGTHTVIDKAVIFHGTTHDLLKKMKEEKENVQLD